MSIYQTIVCDRCGTERRRESSDSWQGWHQEASIKLDGITLLYSGFPDVKWGGMLCGDCASHIDAAVRQLLEPVTAQPSKGNKE